jgi:hypothetical protein
MRRALFSFVVLIVMGIISLPCGAEVNPTADINWEKTSVDFGEIPYRKPVTAEFTFTNRGMIPIIISEVKPSCGCTVAEFPQQPIASGQEGRISVTFDAKSTGYFSKTVSVHANIEGGITKLYIKGTVIK